MYDDNYDLDYWMDAYDDEYLHEVETEILRQAEEVDSDYNGDPEPTDDDDQDL